MEKDALRRGIIDLLASELATLGYDLLDVRLFTGGGRLNVRVFLDREGGINLEGCVAASRTISMLLEESNLLGEAYVIEASSPGVRRPLRTAAHFTAVIGQRVELRAGFPRPTTRHGVLLGVGTEGLRLRAVAPPAAAAAAEAVAAGGDPEGDEAAPAPATAAQGEGEEFTVAWDDLAVANLDPDFDIHALINAERRSRRDAERAERRQAREAREARVARRRKPRTE